MKAMIKAWRYIRRFKKFFIIGITCLILNQLVLLASPLIVKQILDDHINGINQTWYETNTNSDKTVEYNGKYYIQGKYMQNNENSKGVSIVSVKRDYYFVEDVVANGRKSIEGAILKVESKDGEIYYPVQKMAKEEVTSFYNPSIQPLMVLLILLLSISLISVVLEYIQRISTAKISTEIMRYVRLDAVKSMQGLPIEYFEKEPDGKTANRIVGDANGVLGMFSVMTNMVITATISFIFAYIGMFYLDARLTLLTFLFYPIYYIWVKFFTKKLRAIADRVYELNSLIVASLNEIINGITILQVFNNQKSTEKKFDDVNMEYRKANEKEIKLHVTLGWNAMSLLRGMITVFVVLYFGINQLQFGDFIITAGMIYAYNEYLLRIIEPLNIILRNISSLQHSIVQTERVFDIIDRDKELTDIKEIPRYEGNITFKNLWFAYNKDEYVLKDINLDIKAGEMVGLVGHTGSGKSSMMSLLLRFYDLENRGRGEILVDGKNITDETKRTYRQHIGIILQEPVLFKGTIASNIKFGADISDEEAAEILKSIGGENIINKFERGIHQEISSSGDNLSLGEKQLISFARAIVYNPAILVMDEATANIDTETETMIQNALEVVSKDRTMIVIAHRLSTIKKANKIVLLDKGEIKEMGEHNQLLKLDGLYANMYRSQIGENVKAY